MRILTRALITFLSLAFTFVAVQRAAAQHSDAPRIDNLVRAGEDFLEQMQTMPSSWTVKFRLPNGDEAEMRVVRDRDRQSWTFFENVQGSGRRISSLIQKDGIWHVLEKNRAAKYRPYEAELRLPGGYLFLSLSKVRCVVDPAGFKTAIFEGREGSICSYRVPLPPENRRTLEQAISEFDSMTAKDPSFPERSEVADTIRIAREQLAKGSSVRVDEKSGMIVECKVREIVVKVEDFRWLKGDPAVAFALPKDVRWDDQSRRLSKSDLVNCIMVRHDPIFAGGAGKPNLDGYLLNLKSGRLRRLPFQGLVTFPGCFLQDRNEVVVAGFDLSGEVALLKLDLLTSEHTPLDHGRSKGAITLAAELSPDGGRIATVQMLGTGKLLDFQIRLLDLQTGRTRLLGKPSRIGGPFSWLPDGDGLILKRFEPQDDPSAVEPRILCRLGLDGQLTDLRPGDWPVVLRKTRRILYQDNASDLWHTCKLDGTDSQLFAGGMKGYGMPAVSPNEKRVAFVRYEKDQLPQITLFDLGKPEGKPAIIGDGFTTTPVWR